MCSGYGSFFIERSPMFPRLPSLKNVGAVQQPRRIALRRIDSFSFATSTPAGIDDCQDGQVVWRSQLDPCRFHCRAPELVCEGRPIAAHTVRVGIRRSALAAACKVSLVV